MTSPDGPWIRTALERDRVLGIIRADSLTEALTLGRRALGQGLGVVEISATTPDWTRALATLREEYPDAAIGVGTVLHLGLAREAVAAGAQLLVSPGIPTDLDRIVDLGVPTIPGVFSPTDITTALHAGIRTVKLFPAHVLGGSVVRTLLGPFPDVDVVAVGGIRADEVADWTAAGALAVGLGSELQAWISNRTERGLD